MACLLIMPATAKAQSYHVLYDFTLKNSESAPGQPFGTLVRDAKGNSYGTTFNGGAKGFGTVWKLSEAGVLKVLYSFKGYPDGQSPQSGLILDKEGNLYGTTVLGGKQNCGTVFEFSTTTNKEGTLYSFCGTQSDGAEPYGAVVLDPAGNLYGTTFQGGSHSNNGTIFKLNIATRAETVLHSFAGAAGPPKEDGANPFAGLVLDSAGNLYGTTYGGGLGYGTVFVLNTKSRTYKVLYKFTGLSNGDGDQPTAGLVLDSNGNLYGTTSLGGSGNFGCVFGLNSSTGVETVLHSFGQKPEDGTIPYAGLVIDSAENLYGVTSEGGNSGNYGTIFKLDSAHNETVLQAFSGSDGNEDYGVPPGAGLILDSTGHLFGVAPDGGTHGCCKGKGVVFTLTLN